MVKERAFRPTKPRNIHERPSIGSITPLGQGTVGSTNEQGVLDDLNKEFVQAIGNDYLYLPRKEGNIDNLFGEDRITELSKAIPIRMYLENVEGFGGQGYSLEAWGLGIDQTATLVMSRSDWLEKTENSNLKNKYGEARRPFERDFVWDRTTNSLFEVVFVEKQNPFYLAGENYVWKLQVKLAQSQIDSIDQSHDASDPNLGVDIGALNDTFLEHSLGIDNISNGVMRLIVERGGTNYTEDNIRFIFSPADGETSTNIIEPKINETSIRIVDGRLITVSIESPGSGYTLPPDVQAVKADADDFGEEAIIVAILNSPETKTIEKNEGIVNEEGEDADEGSPGVRSDLIADEDNAIWRR